MRFNSKSGRKTTASNEDSNREGAPLILSAHLSRYTPSSDAFAYAQQTRTSTPVMYAAGIYPTHSPTAQQSLGSQPQSQSTWSSLKAAPKSVPVQRRNTLTSETSRPQLLEPSAASRPLSMNSRMMRNPGVQSPHFGPDFNAQQQPASSMASSTLAPDHMAPTARLTVTRCLEPTEDMY